jgi:hypothetical protein
MDESIYEELRDAGFFEAMKAKYKVS